jgi:hypothetical protein
MRYPAGGRISKFLNTKTADIASRKTSVDVLIIWCVFARMAILFCRGNNLPVKYF